MGINWHIKQFHFHVKGSNSCLQTSNDALADYFSEGIHQSRRENRPSKSRQRFSN